MIENQLWSQLSLAMDDSDNQPGHSRAPGKRSVSPSGGAAANANDPKRLKSDGLVENEVTVDSTVQSPELSDSDSEMSFFDDDDGEDLDDVSSSLDFSSSSVTTVAEQGPTIPSSTYNVLSTEEVTNQMDERIENVSFNYYQIDL